MARKWFLRRVLVALFGLLCLLASTTVIVTGVAVNDTSQKIQDDLIAWVRSKGGSVSEKIEIRRVDPSDPTSYMGVFVKEPILAKESLFVIPRDCYIDVFDTAAELDPEDEGEGVWTDYFRNVCQLSKKLAAEMKLGSKSQYAPYIAYLKTQSPGQLPVHWSPQGKDLLRKVAVPGSPIVDWIDWNFKGEKNDCISSSTSSDKEGEISFEEHMLEMTMQRCFDSALIPIWDMVNHHNGKINTENDSMYEPGGLALRASRNLAAGEELYASYDKCLDCLGVEEEVGTPEILKDFGFVEHYPHRWVFTEQNIWLEVDANGEFDPYFGEAQNSTPSQEQLEFLKRELERLETIGETLLRDSEQGDVPDREWRTIQQFQKVATKDLDEVVEWYTAVGSNADEL